MGREVGGGFRIGNSCTPVVDSCQCMAKPIQYCKVKFFLIFLKSLQTINAGEGVQKRKHSCTVVGNVNWYSCYGRWYGDSFKKIGIKSLYDPAIPLLGMYPKETKIEKDTCILLFLAALFSIARTWKQPRCPSTDEWIKKLWYIYTME